VRELPDGAVEDPDSIRYDQVFDAAPGRFRCKRDPRVRESVMRRCAA
jgi:hypothetical protein